MSTTDSPRSPKIAFVFTAADAVGFLFGHVQHLRSHGFDVAVVSSPGANLEAIRNYGATVFPVPMTREIAPSKDIVSLYRLWRVLRKIRPDIAVVGTPKAGLLGGIASVLAGVHKRIYALHGLRLETARGWKRAILAASEKLACRCAHEVHAVSNSLRKRVLELRLSTPEKTTVIGPGSFMGIDVQHYRPQPRSASALRTGLSIPESAPVIGFVGRFTRDKGVSELHRAFTNLRERYPELRLLLVGAFEDGNPIARELRTLIEDDERIIRTGWVSDTAPYYGLMDALVLPTHRKGFPGVPLEAQASAIPVVTTVATGAVDSVLHDKSGFVVPVGDVPALTDAVERLLSDPQLRRAMGETGRRWVTRTFSSDVVLSEYRHAFERLLEKESISRQRGWRRLIKLSADRAVALSAMLLLSPVVLLTAATVRIFLGRPVLFRQKRAGLGGRPIEVVKFRTMLDRRDENGHPLPDEARLTRVGRFLRATSLDELPQLWNVIRGDLSLVGPRPLLMQYLERYTAEQMRRHEVMPGVTGWAQINGRNSLTWEEKFALDLWYVDNWSLGLDLKIILSTFRTLLTRKGVSSDNHATMPEFVGTNAHAREEYK